MVIIFAQDNGVLAQMVASEDFLATLTGTEEEKLIHLANKQLPTGTKYEIIEPDSMTDRTFRDAWEYTAGASEKTSADLSDEDKLKYNQMTQQEYDDANGG